jgi:hypothetical protein
VGSFIGFYDQKTQILDYLYFIGSGHIGGRSNPVVL